jgi:hypothetical protein
MGSESSEHPLKDIKEEDIDDNDGKLIAASAIYKYDSSTTCSSVPNIAGISHRRPCFVIRAVLLGRGGKTNHHPGEH